MPCRQDQFATTSYSTAKSKLVSNKVMSDFGKLFNKDLEFKYHQKLL